MFKNRPGGFIRHLSWKDWKSFFSKMRKRSKLTDIIPEGHLRSKQDVLADIASKDDYIIWLGHASFLIQLSGKKFLIDPFFSKRASPLSWAGPKRAVAAAVSANDLPKIDFILVSHNHYDHLDKNTLQQIADKDAVHVVVPYGLRKIIKKCGFNCITELKWEESFSCGKIKITALPAYHFSSRYILDRNKTLWCSFLIANDNSKLFFSGDTGYGSMYKELGDKYGPFDYGLIGIGAYEPQKIMRAVHLNPEEALLLAADMSIKTVIPMHWGTMPFTLEPLFEPIQRFEAEISNNNPATIKCKRLPIGGITVL